VDADMGYTVMARLVMPEGTIASALFQGSETASGRFPNGLAFYGTKGSLHLSGFFFPETIEHFDRDRRSWEEIPIPDEARASSSPGQEDSSAERLGSALPRAPVADVRGEVCRLSHYSTMAAANVVIDSAQRGMQIVT
jgi:hypothetical protein